jgi:RNA polymerase sigma factor (TIGR02999 family)
MPGGVTELLVAWNHGDRDALDRMFPLVYSELRKLAGYHLSGERKGHTLQATALVHEAYVRLIQQNEVDWQNHAQFFGVASQIMRRILVSHARAKYAQKRGGMAERVSLSVADSGNGAAREVDVVALDDALATLAEKDLRKSKVVELKFFGGLTNREVAKVLEISDATVEREWAVARAWLYCEISGSSRTP